MNFVKEFDKLNIIIKFILTFFFGWIIGGVYRLLKGRIVWGVLWILTVGLFGIGWLIDLITVALNNKYTFLV